MTPASARQSITARTSLASIRGFDDGSAYRCTYPLSCWRMSEHRHPAPLSGKVALVTGAGRGIGAAIVARLAEDGAEVAVCDVDEAQARAVAERVAETSGRRAIAVAMDVAEEASVREGVAAVAGRLGPVDVLVNNAGIDVIGPFLESAEEAWHRIIAVNLV